uniref:Solute carrier family 15 member 2 n=1 Tax=Cyprinus carpio carpio TaxID=630221 RepID=A0A8C1D1K1_CYPCA
KTCLSDWKYSCLLFSFSVNVTSLFVIRCFFVCAQKLCGTNYPVSIAFIVVNEFCERFSYYGMKAVLTLYFIHYLHWDKNLSTAVYHAFSSLCYFTPLLGAVIADSWLGKFRTVIYLSIVYVIGHVVKSVGAIPDVGDSTVHVVLSMLGLVLIAFGTGGIKPCVAAFGGDQFDEEHTEERRKFFSIFYMSINAGSVLSTIITPILRGDVKCFGGDCYALAFGVPAALMVIALVVFIAGSGLYKKSPPEGNVLVRVCKCIGFAIRNRWNNSKKSPKRSHWLDWAEEKYPKRLIQEIKMVFRVLVLYIPLPMFWALFDQQVKCYIHLISFVFSNTQIIVSISLKGPIHPQMKILSIQFFLFIFSPLKKMAAGMILAALAFCAATVVEINVIPPPAKESLVQVYNLMDSEVTVQFPGHTVFSDPLKSYEVTSLQYRQTLITFYDVYTFNVFSVYITIIHYCSKVWLNYNGLTFKKMEDIQANNIHIAWQVPQYVFITAGEVMFSITGLEFSYSQAPASMKSVLQAGWLMTVAFGNVIVLIVAEGAGMEQWTEFLLFAGLLVAVSIIFSIMAYFYTYVDPDQLDKIFREDTDDEKVESSDGKKNEAVSLTDMPKQTKM